MGLVLQAGMDMARGGVSGRALALTTPSVATTKAPVLGLREKVRGQIAATRGKLDMLLACKKWKRKEQEEKACVQLGCDARVYT